MARDPESGDTRRRALLRLGLGTAIAYSTPTLIRVDRSANATVLPTPCAPPGGHARGGQGDHCPPGRYPPGYGGGDDDGHEGEGGHGGGPGGGHGGGYD